MPLTPADVHSVVFNKSPIGKRGYHEDEVDAFLDLIEAELARLVAENEELRNRLEQVDQHQDAAAVDTESACGPSEPCCPEVTAVEQAVVEGDPNAHAARVLGLAQQMADRLTSQAQAEADAVLDQARIQAEQLLGDAKAKVDGLFQEVRTRAEAVLTDARANADALERQSREHIALREREAARQHSKTITVLNQEKRPWKTRLIDCVHWNVTTAPT